MSDNWIKLHRLLTAWEWYTTPNMVHFWVHCLLSANHAEGYWRGIKVERGQFISGRKSLSANTGLSEQQIRTCIERLKSTNELTSHSTNEYTIFTLISWEKYQIGKPFNQPSTNEQPASNQPATTNKNEKKKKNEKNNTVFPTLEEADGFAKEKKLDVVDVSSWYESRTIADWTKTNGETVKNWKLDLINCNKFEYFAKKGRVSQQPAYDRFVAPQRGLDDD